tara:strand:- start:101 stop:478 length:378 start_codon:yes stop_codon:yes gene_type:complete
VKKGLIEKQAGAFVAPAALTYAMKKEMIPATMGPLPSSAIVAGLLAVGTMFSRNNLLLGASLGTTGMAAAQAMDAWTTAGVMGSREMFAHSTYRPADELLGFDEYEDEDELLGEEEYEFIDEIDL